jgi:hypothetical protein
VSDSAWWREELWWEKGLFQLGGNTISARQLGTLSAICIFALMASIPASFPISGVTFAGRVIVFGLIVLIGYFGLVQRRVKAVPVELQLYFWLRKGKARARKAVPAGPGAASIKEKAEVETHQVLVEDFENPTPFSFTGRVRVDSATRVQLVIGKEVRDEAAVTAENGEYRLIYKPRPRDVGVQDCTLKLQGTDRPISSFRIVINAKGVNLLESKEKAR